jgi:hypothetical protein
MVLVFGLHTDSLLYLRTNPAFCSVVKVFLLQRMGTGINFFNFVKYNFKLSNVLRYIPIGQAIFRAKKGL